MIVAATSHALFIIPPNNLMKDNELFIKVKIFLDHGEIQVV